MNAEEVNSAPEVSTVPQAPEGIQPGLEDRTKALGAIEQAKANLGEVAAKVNVLPNGIVETPGESTERLASGDQSHSENVNRI